MRMVRHLLEVKGHEVFAIGPDAAVIDAIRLMAEKGVGALLVMRGPELVGMLSERDYARKIVLEGLSSKSTPVSEIMSGNPVTVRMEDHVPHCMEIVTRQRVRHLPVVDGDGQVLGLVSIGDLVNSVIADQQHELDQLHNYIAG